MQDLKQFSEDLEEWATHPMTKRVKAAAAKVLQARKEQLLAAYWAGQAFPEADRKALELCERWADDFFNSAADDVLWAESLNTKEPYEWPKDDEK